jgi:hypothetical protein
VEKIQEHIQIDKIQKKNPKYSKIVARHTNHQMSPRYAKHLGIPPATGGPFLAGLSCYKMEKAN